MRNILRCQSQDSDFNAVLFDDFIRSVDNMIIRTFLHVRIQNWIIPVCERWIQIVWTIIKFMVP